MAATRWVDIPEGEEATQKIREMVRRYEGWNEKGSSGILRALVTMSATRKPPGFEPPGDVRK